MADAVKAELARRDLSAGDLVVPLGLGRNAIYARLRHEKPFDIAELEAAAAFMGIPMSVLMASAELGAVAA